MIKTAEQAKEKKELCIPDEVKIVHIHKDKEEKSSFIEFVILRNGKVHLLTFHGFVKRYGAELIEAFKSSKAQ